jgi:lysine biosynthesis protein LysW
MPSKQAPKPDIGVCPSCDTKIRFRNNLYLGQLVTCQECGDVLEVVRLNPVKLDWAFEEPFEDDDYDEFEFEDNDDYGDFDEEDADFDNYDDDDYGDYDD